MGSAKCMGGGKRTRERARPKNLGPLQKSFWSAQSWIFAHEKQSNDTRGGWKTYRTRGGPKPLFSGKSKWGLSNGGVRPRSAVSAQSSTTVRFCGLFGPLSKGSFRHKTSTIIGNRGQLWTSTLSPHLLSPHLDLPDFWEGRHS